MSKRGVISGEKHHWWPQSVSSRWVNASGQIQRIDTTGQVIPSSPKNTACISDGHNIKFGSPWDSTFEQEFDSPDNNFPYIVDYLERMVPNHSPGASIEKSGFCAHDVDDAQLESLTECLVSLVVRSPKFRNQAVGDAQLLRNEVPKTEHKILSAANVQQTYLGLKRNLSGRGKFLLIFARNREFIFGDGLYNNISVGSMHMSNALMVVPLTRFC